LVGLRLLIHAAAARDTVFPLPKTTPNDAKRRRTFDVHGHKGFDAPGDSDGIVAAATLV
jgi:hypothetical protein